MTACLIVRDEGARLASCLQSLREFVDATVVCDTGSTDDTVDIARRAGAIVTSARWTDDFAAARNAALSVCTTDWVLSVDADETVQGVASWLAPMLAACEPDVAALSVQIVNAGGPDARGLLAHRELKLLRRGPVRWTGRVHERLVGADGGELLADALPSDAMSLVHHGYCDPAVVAAKADRNARLSSLELDELVAAGARDSDIARVALDVGRSAFACGRAAAAVAALHQARDAAREGSVWAIWAWATDFLIRIALTHGEVRDADALVGELTRSGAPAAYCRWLLAQVLLQRGDVAAAQLLLNGITRIVDLSGNELDLEQVHRAQDECIARLRVAAT